MHTPKGLKEKRRCTARSIVSETVAELNQSVHGGSGEVACEICELPNEEVGGRWGGA